MNDINITKPTDGAEWGKFSTNKNLSSVDIANNIVDIGYKDQSGFRDPTSNQHNFLYNQLYRFVLDNNKHGLNTWDFVTTYPLRALVHYQDEVYVSERINSNKQPDSNIADWKKISFSATGSAVTFNDLTDVTILTPLSKNIPIYNTVSGQWENAFVSALNVTYSNGGSTLTANDVENALDELDGKVEGISAGTSTALATTYNSADSTLTSANVKDALDDLDVKVENVASGTVIASTVTTILTGNTLFQTNVQLNIDELDNKIELLDVPTTANTILTILDNNTLLQTNVQLNIDELDAKIVTINDSLTAFSLTADKVITITTNNSLTDTDLQLNIDEMDAKIETNKANFIGLSFNAVDILTNNSGNQFTGLNVQSTLDEVSGLMGNLGTLTTTNKTNLVSAINEVNANTGGGGGGFTPSFAQFTLNNTPDFVTMTDGVPVVAEWILEHGTSDFDVDINSNIVMPNNVYAVGFGSDVVIVGGSINDAKEIQWIFEHSEDGGSIFTPFPTSPINQKYLKDTTSSEFYLAIPNITGESIIRVTVTSIGGVGTVTIPAMAGSFHIVAAVEGVSNVDSVNGQTGTVSLDTDDISDSISANKYVTATEKSLIGTIGDIGDFTSGASNVVDEVNNVRQVAEQIISSNNVTYDNTGTSLTSTNVESALGEIDVKVEQNATDIANFSGGGGSALDTTYSNVVSLLTAINVQDAIDEVEGRLDTVENTTLQSDDIVYDNTNSGLTATNVETAIDEVEARVDVLEADIETAIEVTYSNTTSGLTATNVQTALDEIVAFPSSGGGTAIDTTYNNATSGLVANDVQAAIDENDARIDILEGAGGGGDASDIAFDNVASGLSGITVQQAIDEVDNNLDNLNADDIAEGASNLFLTPAERVSIATGLDGNSILNDLADVEIINPQEGDIIVFDGDVEKWKNQAQSSGGATAGAVVLLDDAVDLNTVRVDLGASMADTFVLQAGFNYQNEYVLFSYTLRTLGNSVYLNIQDDGFGNTIQTFTVHGDNVYTVIRTLTNTGSTLKAYVPENLVISSSVTAGGLVFKNRSNGVLPYIADQSENIRAGSGEFDWDMNFTVDEIFGSSGGTKTDALTLVVAMAKSSAGAGFVQVVPDVLSAFTDVDKFRTVAFNSSGAVANNTHSVTILGFNQK